MLNPAVVPAPVTADEPVAAGEAVLSSDHAELGSYVDQLVDAATPSNIVIAMEDSLLRRGVVASLASFSRQVQIIVTEPGDEQVATADLVITTAAAMPDPRTSHCVVITIDEAAPDPDAAPLNIPTSASPEQLLEVVSRVLRTASPSTPRLSKRELEILALLAQGLATQQIAQHCFISADTVKTHMARIFKKLKVNDRASAVFSATAAGILSLG